MHTRSSKPDPKTTPNNSWAVPWLTTSTADRAGAVTSIRDLHASYSQWCEAHGVAPRSIRSLSQCLGRLGYGYACTAQPYGRGSIGSREGLAITWPPELAAPEPTDSPWAGPPEPEPVVVPAYVPDPEILQELESLYSTVSRLRGEMHRVHLRIRRVIDHIERGRGR